MLTSAKLKEGTLNVTLSRQSLIELISSYVKPNTVFTDYEVTKVDVQSELPMLHFSKHASQTFDLCIERMVFIQSLEKHYSQTLK